MISFAPKEVSGATGLPIGVQLVALPYQEELLCRALLVCEALQQDMA